MSNDTHAKSFEEIYEEFIPMIHSIFRRYHIRNNLEDYYQEALLALWEAYQRFDPQYGEFAPYAYSVIRGRILTLLSKEIYHQDHSVLTLHPFEKEYDPFLSIDSLLVLKNTLQTLTPLEVNIFYGKWLMDMPMVEVARELNISYDKAKDIGQKLRRKLQQALREKR